jgi:cobalt-zinc-cadmium efflux system protein
VAFFLNLGFTVVEVAGGVATSSVAVLSDAVHDLGDCLVLGAAWYLQRIALRGRDAQYSYGYGRFSMLGGWMAAIVLIAGSVWMLATALPRLSSPGTPHANGMMALAVFGIVMNGLAAWRLHAGRSLNERGARLHLLEDLLGWAAVLVGGALIRITGWAVIDPLLSIGISLFILLNAVRTLRTGTGILMQAQPDASEAQRITTALRAIPYVLDVHDQHVWSLDGSYTVLTVHLVVDDLAQNAHLVRAHARSTLTGLGIDHATIELESTDEVCQLQHH